MYMADWQLHPVGDHTQGTPTPGTAFQYGNPISQLLRPLFCGGETYCWSCDSLFQHSHAPVNQALLLRPALPLSTQCGPSSLFLPFFLFSLSLSFPVLFSLPLRQVPLQESDVIQGKQLCSITTVRGVCTSACVCTCKCVWGGGERLCACTNTHALLCMEARN